MMTKRKFLVSGYGPFGSYESNPSSVIVSELKNMEFPDDLELTFAVVDVDYAEALRCSQHACTELAVDVCIKNILIKNI
jgi:pyrrolidone-carboxylate peptidase